MSTGKAGGAASNATVSAEGPSGDYDKARLADADKAVKTIEDKLAGMKQSLADAKAEAKRLRDERG